MYIYICDDSKSDRLRLLHHLKVYLEDMQLSESYEVMEFSDGNSLVSAWMEAEEKPLLIFLDIYMGEPNGIDTAGKLREKGAECSIIFTTSSNEFAAESYRVHALYYLCKPYDHKEFESAMEVCKAMLQNAAKKYQIQIRGERIEIPIRLIKFFETGNHVVLLHTDFKDYSFVSSMSKVRDFFDRNENFLPVGSSYLVNIRYIKERRKDCLIMQGGQMISIPVREQKRINRELEQLSVQLGILDDK